MQINELVRAIQVVELSAVSRCTAIRELVDAVNWTNDGVTAKDVVEAIEEREAAAQTIVAKGFALPHAIVDWTGDFRVVLGRSLAGVDYVATGDVLHLIVVLVVGKRGVARHLELLAAVAELLGDIEFRQKLVQAGNVRDIQQLLVARVGQHTPERKLKRAEMPRSTAAVGQPAVGLAESLAAQAILLAMDQGQSVPWEPLSSWRGRLLIVTSKNVGDSAPVRADTHLFDIPHASLSRVDRANLGLLLAAANGLADHDEDVVCITGPHSKALDSITVSRPAAHFSAVFINPEERKRTSISPAVILRVLSLAIELSAEGRESHPMGATFVVGDTRQVMRHTQQLVLNPFHGYARRLRNVLDPSLTETVKEFAFLDGAFIVEADGSIRSAGSYLIPKVRVEELLGGLGARHQAAAAITVETRAIAVTVSQSTGTVTLFQDGAVVLTLERASLTRW